MRPTVWLRGALAFLMGALVGGYRLAMPLPLPLWLPVAISILVVSAPVALVALRNSAILSRATLIAILALPILLLGMLLVRIFLPSVFGPAGNFAVKLAFAIALLCAPAAAAFTLSVPSPQPEPGGGALRRRATAYALLAWAGIGVQNIVFPYLIPASVILWYTAMGAGPSLYAGLARLVLGIALFAIIAWLMGFALAMAEGAGVARLFSRVAARTA